KDFKQLGDPARPWEGDYHYEIVATESEVEPEADDKGDDKDEDDEAKEKAKKKRRRSPISQFRLVVLMSNISEVPEKDLPPEERASRDRIQALSVKAIRGMGKMAPKEMEKLGLDIAREASVVTPEQMERFLRRQLAAHGGLEVKNLEFKET